VMVVRSGEPITLEVRLPIEFVNDALSWQLKLEQGGLLSGQLTPIDGELVGVAEFEEMECQAYRVALAVQPELGYHDLILLEEGNA
ncbi:4-alpha-glucanotransferase, partial [Aeromonas salmonicida]